MPTASKKLSLAAVRRALSGEGDLTAFDVVHPITTQQIPNFTDWISEIAREVQEAYPRLTDDEADALADEYLRGMLDM